MTTYNTFNSYELLSADIPPILYEKFDNDTLSLTEAMFADFTICNNLVKLLTNVSMFAQLDNGEEYFLASMNFLDGSGFVTIQSTKQIGYTGKISWNIDAAMPYVEIMGKIPPVFVMIISTIHQLKFAEIASKN